MLKIWLVETQLIAPLHLFMPTHLRIGKTHFYHQ